MFDLSCQGGFFMAFINLKTLGAEIERCLKEEYKLLH